MDAVEKAQKGKTRRESGAMTGKPKPSCRWFAPDDSMHCERGVTTAPILG